MPGMETVQGDSMVRTLVRVGLVVLIAYVGTLALGELKGLRFIGSGVSATNTVTVSGEGEEFAVPDTAEFSVSVQEEAKEVKSAQEVATKKGNEIISYLESQGVEKKDIRTTDYSVYPQYDYVSDVCANGGYCRPGKQVLRGYQVSQTLTVRVRDTEKAGDILSGVGSRGASFVSGLSFTIDDQDALEARARGEAIDDARAKAETLAKQLGVSLVRVVGFSEGGDRPVYYAKAMSMAADGMGGMEAAPAPQIPTGENKITSNVSITYEIQ